MSTSPSDILVGAMRLYKLILWALYISHMGVYSYMALLGTHHMISTRIHNIGLWVVTIIVLGFIPFSYFVLMVALEDVNKGYILCDVSDLKGNTTFLLVMLGIIMVCGAAFYGSVYNNARIAIIMVTLILIITFDVYAIIIPSIIGRFMYRRMRPARILGIPCVDIAHVARNLILLHHNIINLDIIKEEWSHMDSIIGTIAQYDGDVKKNMARFLRVLEDVRSGPLSGEVELVKKRLGRQYRSSHYFILGNIIFLLAIAYEYIYTLG